jgi:hypothetical protein
MKFPKIQPGATTYWEVKTAIGLVKKTVDGRGFTRFEHVSMGIVTTDQTSDAFRLLKNLCAAGEVIYCDYQPRPQE